MRKIMIILVLMLIPLTVSAQSLFVMGWDGSGWKNIEPMLQAGRLPNLEGLINQTGQFPFPIDIHGKPDTTNSWTRVWTGLDPDQTGVDGNKRILRIKNKYTQWMVWEANNFNIFMGYGGWLRPVPYRHTIMKAIQDQGVSVGWFLSKTENAGGVLKAPLGKIKKNADKKLTALPGDGNSYIYDLRAAASGFINNAQGDFILFLHVNPDEYGHKFGENNSRYIYEMERADKVLGDMLAILPFDAGIIILTDHGFDEGLKSHRNASDAWGWTNLPIDSGYEFQPGHHPRANMRDIGTTLLDWYGINWQARVPVMRGKSLLQ